MDMPASTDVDSDNGIPALGKPWISWRLFDGHLNRNKGKTLTSFSYFNALPIELRLNIWELHIQPNKPGIVEVSIKHASKSPEYRRVISWRKRKRYQNLDIRPVSPIPAVLHICKESRMEASRYYRLSFGHNAWHLPRTYLKYPLNSSSTIDTICLYVPRERSRPRRFSMHEERMGQIRAGAIACINDHDVKHLGLFTRARGESPSPFDILSRAQVFLLMMSCVETLDVIVDTERRPDACTMLVTADGLMGLVVLDQLVRLMEMLKKSNHFPPDRYPSVTCKTLVRGGDGTECGKEEKGGKGSTLIDRLKETWRSF